MNDPHFAPYEIPPTKDQPVKKHGCFFYGCITAIVLLVVMILLGYVGYRYLMYLRDQWTSPTPEMFAKVEMSAEAREALEKRVQEFRKALEAQEPVAPLMLNSDEINALIEDNPTLKGRVHVEIKGDKIEGQLSWPIPNTGRFLNGSADLRVSLKDDVLIVNADAISVKGRPVPESFMQGFRQQNLAEDAYKNPKNAEELRKIESIEVKDGTIIIKPRPKTEGSAEAKKTGDTS
jgi:hypothetical protein